MPRRSVRALPTCGGEDEAEPRSFVPAETGNRSKAGTESHFPCVLEGKEAEAVVPVAVAGVVPVPVRGAAVLRVVPVAPAAENAVVARSLSALSKAFELAA